MNFPYKCFQKLEHDRQTDRQTDRQMRLKTLCHIREGRGKTETAVLDGTSPNRTVLIDNSMQRGKNEKPQSPNFRFK